MKGIVNVPGVSGADIAAHNLSPEAHPDLRQEMEDLKKQPSELAALIAAHNADKAAHADIRQKLSEVAEQQSQEKTQLDKLAQAQSQAAVVYRTVTLAVANWDASAKTQTVTVTGVSAKETDQLIIPTPALANQEAYLDAGIRATAQKANSLTFAAESTPEEALTVYVTIIPLGGGTV